MVWDTRTGECIYVLDEHVGNNIIYNTIKKYCNNFNNIKRGNI